MSQKDTGFSDRLAYVRWLRACGRSEPESDTELAASAGLGYPLLSKWKSRTDAPDTHSTREKFRTGLRLEGAWLFDGLGAAPEPELWKHWVARHRAASITQIPASAFKPARKTGSAKRRKER